MECDGERFYKFVNVFGNEFSNCGYMNLKIDSV